MSNRKTYTTIDAYIADCPAGLQPLLQTVRETIQRTAPQATEKISWSMPTFYQKGNLVHFALAKNHLGIYPGANGIAQFQDEFDRLGYKHSKGAVQFPLNQPIPYDLIERIVLFRLEETEKA